MPKITPFLWFNDNAEEAMNFYVSVFKNSHVLSVSPMMVRFKLEGVEFMALNGGPHFTFTPAISLFVDCADQADVDELWAKMLEGGGKESRCGWLTDKFGLSWQIIPKQLAELMGDPDREKAGRAIEAMMAMTKIEVEPLQRAFDGA
jgi:predicted 3-demethylubiquinone-9 3-methyltransferase (glyoxalase superfamily)